MQPKLYYGKLGLSDYLQSFISIFEIAVASFYTPTFFFLAQRQRIVVLKMVGKVLCEICFRCFVCRFCCFFFILFWRKVFTEDLSGCVCVCAGGWDREKDRRVRVNDREKCLRFFYFSCSFRLLQYGENLLCKFSHANWRAVASFYHRRDTKCVLDEKDDLARIFAIFLDQFSFECIWRKKKKLRNKKNAFCVQCEYTHTQFMATWFTARRIYEHLTGITLSDKSLGKMNVP